MKQWNGLVWKEWMPHKQVLLFSSLFMGVVIFTIPILLGRYTDIDASLMELTIILSFIWALFSSLVPAYFFISSLKRDLKRPDVWLHSTASIFKLMGAKMVPALAAGAISLLLSGIILAFRYAITSPKDMDFDMLLKVGTFLLVTLFSVSIFLLCSAFFFFTISLLLKPYVKELSLPAAFVLAILSIPLLNKLLDSSTYIKITHFGAIPLTSFQHLDYTGSPLSENPYPDYLYSGEILFDLLIVSFLFITSSLLFEKKVRL